ncbi:hypothetical protein SALBM311S_12705 [Streptomyces alboniger]
MTRLLTAYGAQVNVVSEPHPTGGWQQARRERVQQLMAQHPDSWCPDQYNNPDNTTAYTPLAGAFPQLVADVAPRPLAPAPVPRPTRPRSAP